MRDRNYREFLNKLVSLKKLKDKSGEEIVEEIASNLYEGENYLIFQEEYFYKIPEQIRDVILLINFDTELAMEGILGFLENSSGVYLNDTIETLEKIKAEQDHNILNNIKHILDENNISTSQLRANTKDQELYSIQGFSETHGSAYDDMADRICEIAEKLYISSEDRNIFDYLILYVDKNKSLLITELNK
ncbi:MULTISPECIES: DUF4375 domain-containing protein [Bacillaceae]|uniref:DNA mimic protein DMP19 C-terminal domain-containing protein n=1 Tax=Gottfriedia luciferensis TaxID=178774 RepID=A0ABX2ZX11_9BACI|nr:MULTISPECIES: DUF4375 domain-containing protein [Bacillaceae]ODG93190.1 hypothetical protein BED47_02560 [Gottfriedia luciferensis]PGZ95158.1 DUF4375 domain-containing protein [Bacillus sp. AFS029533]SFC56483.1 protein of unknown function [Bacillus sp. UNCCL81]